MTEPEKGAAMVTQPTMISRRRFITLSAGGLASAGIARYTPVQAHHATASTEICSFRVMGRTGIKVSPIGLGAPRIQEPSILNMALERGINFIDTGRSYANGQNEIMVGNVVQGMRDKVVIQSKIKLRIRKDGEDFLKAGAAGRITQQCEISLTESLKALNTDYIDIMLLHGIQSPDMLRLEPVMNFFEKARTSGKIRACGFSAHLNMASLIRSAIRLNVYDVAMIAFNHQGAYVHALGGYRYEWDQDDLILALKEAVNSSMGIVAMKTCSGGPRPHPDGGPSTYENALQWIVDKNYVHTSAVAMANADQVEENLKAMLF